MRSGRTDHGISSSSGTNASSGEDSVSPPDPAAAVLRAATESSPCPVSRFPCPPWRFRIVTAGGGPVGRGQWASTVTEKENRSPR
ncbi:hypothetical protein SCMC78_60760 [Streptomyces sp. CMC78]|uniref:Uncharacterized protein n=1 Tax=Streptomyces sp. CMC78 TaxID=3231512 RepID=A0AB33KL97_9ACTN|nr:hypothetical protein GCM10010504_63070 [Streptomyces griseus]